MKQDRYTFDKLPIFDDYINKSLKSLPFEPESDITYKFNDYGYRGNEDLNDVIKSDYIVCIGCSFTFGVGLEYEQTWPYKLSKKLNKKLLNLGWPGASQQYVGWQIKNILDNFTNKNIFVLIPPLGREMHLNDKSFTNYNHDEFKILFNQDNDGLRLAELNDFILKTICNHYNIPFLYSYDYGLPDDEEWLPKAKDNMHFGEKWHEFISNKFYEKIKK